MPPVCVCVHKQNHRRFCFLHFSIRSEALTLPSELLFSSFTRFCQHLLHSKIFDPPELSPSPTQLGVVPRVFAVLDQKDKEIFFFFFKLFPPPSHPLNAQLPSPSSVVDRKKKKISCHTSLHLTVTLARRCRGEPPGGNVDLCWPRSTELHVHRAAATWSLKWSPHTSKWRQHPKTHLFHFKSQKKRKKTSA